MLLKWARWFPYWVVVKLSRGQYSSDGRGILKLDKDYPVTYYRLGEGEFLVFSQDIQNKFIERKREKRKEKDDKKFDKINKILDDDYSLKMKLKEQFEFERKNEDEY